MRGVTRLELEKISRDNASGSLNVLNPIQLREVQFSRFFFFSDVPGGSRRGGHAHRLCVQLLIPLDSKVEFQFMDTRGKVMIERSEAGVAYLVDPYVWVDLLFLEPESSLLVAASEAFSEDDYIRELNDFLEQES